MIDNDSRALFKEHFNDRLNERVAEIGAIAAMIGAHIEPARVRLLAIEELTYYRVSGCPIRKSAERLVLYRASAPCAQRVAVTMEAFDFDGVIVAEPLFKPHEVLEAADLAVIGDSDARRDEQGDRSAIIIGRALGGRAGSLATRIAVESATGSTQGSLEGRTTEARTLAEKWIADAARSVGSRYAGSPRLES